MQAFAVFGVFALCWFGGRALSCASGFGTARHRLFLELLAGVVLISTLGLAFSALGVFSLPALVGSLLALYLLGRLFSRPRAGRYGSRDFLGVGVFVLALLWVGRPFDTSLYGVDSSIYVATGIRTAERGGFVFSDPTVLALPEAARKEFFPPYARGSGPPYARLTGGFYLPSLESDRVLPAFHPLLPVWLALFYGLGGDEALFWASPFFHAFGTWAIAIVAGELGGLAAAIVAALALDVLFPQYWYARLAMPEVASSAFLWGGLAVLLSAKSASWVAGAALGLTALVRLEVGFLVCLTGLLWLGLAPRAWQPASRTLLGFAGGVFLAVLHHVFFPTHYAAEVAALVERSLAAWPWWASLLPLFLLLRGGKLAPWFFVRPVALFASAIYLARAYGLTSGDHLTPLSWLERYCGLPVLLAGAVGIGIAWHRAREAPAVRFGLLLGVLGTLHWVWNPQVSPAPLWGIRRFVPPTMPLLALGSAFFLAALPRGRFFLFPVLAALWCFWMPLVSAWQSRLESTYTGGLEHVRTLGVLIPEGSLLLGSPRLLLASRLHAALWALRDTPPYFVDAHSHRRFRTLASANPGQADFLGRPTRVAPEPGPDFGVLPVASYDFVVSLRRLDAGDPRDEAFRLRVALGLYEIVREKEKGEVP
ncbi:MAG: hypothetical protein KatS3mg076_0300 [Candidatus Binatia bacterium]|nr:MAG: hypothetical protein KatS3mg076_0300 [Candidatus Binatia bacterium]